MTFVTNPYSLSGLSNKNWYAKVAVGVAVLVGMRVWVGFLVARRMSVGVGLAGRCGCLGKLFYRLDFLGSHLSGWCR